MVLSVEQSKLKWIIILSVIAVALGTAVFVVYGPGKKTISDIKTGGLIYPDFDPAAVAAIKIKKGNSSIEMKLDAGKWVLASAGNYPADDEKIKSFLDKTKAMKKEDVRGTNPDKFAKFEVGNDGLLSELLDASGMTLAYFHIGKNAEDYQSTYVRFYEGKEVIVTRENLKSVCSEDYKFWIKRTALSVDSQKISELSISSVVQGQETAQVIHMKKSGDAPAKWGLTAPVETSADQGTASSVASAAANLRIEDLVKDKKDLKEYGLDVPSVVVTLVMDDKSTHKISFGKDDGSSHFYTIVDDQPFVILCGKSQVDQFGKNADAFIDKQICTIDANNLSKIEIFRPDTPDVLLTRNADSREWSVSGTEQGQMNLQTVNNIINTVVSFRANSVLLDPSRAEVDSNKWMEKLVLTETGDKKTVLYVLKPSQDGASYYVKKEDSSAIYVVGKGFGENLLKQPADFVSPQSEGPVKPEMPEQPK